VTKAASCDELFGSFAEAAFVTALRLFTGLDIQDHKGRKEIFSADNMRLVERGVTTRSEAEIIPFVTYYVTNGTPWCALNERGKSVAETQSFSGLSVFFCGYNIRQETFVVKTITFR
jgi:hypothetical protein